MAEPARSPIRVVVIDNSRWITREAVTRPMRLSPEPLDVRYRRVASPEMASVGRSKSTKFATKQYKKALRKLICTERPNSSSRHVNEKNTRLNTMAMTVRE